MSWLERQAAERKIPFTKLGGEYRFTDAHLAEIIRLNEHGPRDEKPEVKAVPSARRSRRERPSINPGTCVPLKSRPITKPA